MYDILPDCEIGDVWYCKRPKALGLCELQITDITDFTIQLKVLPWGTLERYKIVDIELVECLRGADHDSN